MSAVPTGLPSLIDANASREKGVFKATVKWRLSVDFSSASLIDLLPDRVAFLFNTVLPLEGDPYPGVPLATCRGVKCNHDGINGVYIYEAKFSDENSSESEPGTDKNPLDDRAIVKPTAGMQSRAITKDREGEAILNSAGDPIAQSMDDNTIGLRITANIAYVPPWVGALRNTCNSGPISVRGLPIAPEAARFVLPDGWLSDEKNRNDISYFEFTYELLIDEKDKHYGYPLDAGFRKLVFDANWNDVPVTITNKDGSEVTEPVPLDGSGEVLENPQPDTVKYQEVKKYPTADYSFLPGID